MKVTHKLQTLWIVLGIGLIPLTGVSAAGHAPMPDMSNMGQQLLL